MGAAERSIIKRIYFILMIGFLASMTISYNAWFALTDFPTVSFWAFEVPFYVFQSLSGILATLVFIQPFAFSSRLIPRAIILIMFLLFVLNQTLVQPWAWMYFLMIWLLSPFARYHYQYKELAPLLRGFQVLMALIYIASGALKIHPEFGSWTLPYILQPITNFFWQFKDELEGFFLFVPYFEIVFGASLLLPQIARFSRFGLIAMHLAILGLLGPLGLNNNTVVWPWNIQMILLLLVVFPHGFRKVEVFPIRFLIYKKPINYVIGLVLIAAGLHFASLGNAYLAFDLYSGRTAYPQISLTKNELKRIPKSIDRFTYAEGDSIYVNYFLWGYETLNIPPCPAPWCDEVFEDKIINRVTD